MLPHLRLTPNCEDPQIDYVVESLEGTAGMSIIEPAIYFESAEPAILIQSENFALINQTATITIQVVSTDDEA